MNIAIDYGNSSAKVGIFDDQQLREKHSFESFEKLHAFLEHDRSQNMIVCSVSEDPRVVVDLLQSAKKRFILDHNLPLPMVNLYKTPNTLGVDRIAGVCGAMDTFPGENCLVIDAGTCITYDLIDKEKRYHGGAISPGLNMRFKAVHTFTAKLPLVSPKENVALIGVSTESSIQSGVVNGLIAEIEGVISAYQQKFEGLKVILCGGDTRFFENQLKPSIFASPELVLIGLNSILRYNVNR